jgi:hypothetical protein
VRGYGIFVLTLILGGGLLLVNGPQKQPTQGQSSAKPYPVKEKLVCPAVLPSDCTLTFSGDFTRSYHYPCETARVAAVIPAGAKGDQDNFTYSSSSGSLDSKVDFGFTVLLPKKVQERMEYDSSNAENMVGSLHLVGGNSDWGANYVSDPVSASAIPKRGSFQVIFCSAKPQPPYLTEVHGLAFVTLEPNSVTSAKALVTAKVSF